MTVSGKNTDVALQRIRQLYGFIVNHRDFPFDTKVTQLIAPQTSFDVVLPKKHNKRITIVCSPQVNDTLESKCEYWFGLFDGDEYLTEEKYGYPDHTKDFHTNEEAFQEIIRLADISRNEDIDDEITIT